MKDFTFKDLQKFFKFIRPAGALLLASIQAQGGAPTARAFEMPEQLDVALNWVKNRIWQGRTATTNPTRKSQSFPDLLLRHRRPE